MAAYVTVAEVKNEGLPSTYSNSRISAAIIRWQQFIERACRQFFDARAATVDMDGNDTDTLFLPMPLISVSALYVNDDFDHAVPASTYRAYTQRGPVEDDRRNPKIRILRATTVFDPLYSRGGGVRFLKGSRNQRVVGTWGFTEEDGTTPLLIKRALIKMVIIDLTAQGASPGGLYGDVTASPDPAGSVTSETTDGHVISFGNDATLPDESRTGLTSITKDEEITKILEAYKGPIVVAVPGSVNWFMG